MSSNFVIAIVRRVQGESMQITELNLLAPTPSKYEHYIIFMCRANGIKFRQNTHN